MNEQVKIRVQWGLGHVVMAGVVVADKIGGVEVRVPITEDAAKVFKAWSDGGSIGLDCELEHGGRGYRPAHARQTRQPHDGAQFLWINV